jgi:hypothetical protein
MRKLWTIIAGMALCATACQPSTKDKGSDNTTTDNTVSTVKVPAFSADTAYA